MKIYINSYSNLDSITVVAGEADIELTFAVSLVATSVMDSTLFTG